MTKMKWHKLGRIFNPKLSPRHWAASYAALPFAEPISNDLYRIYFSARDQRNRSRAGYLELDMRHPSTILRVSNQPLLDIGKDGTFDDSGAMLSWVTQSKGKKYFYYIGWNLGVTVPFRNSIGLAISEDGGHTVKKYSEGPVIDRDVFDPYFVASCCVLLDGGIWRMWYLSCRGWDLVKGKLRHRYHIRYAESKDGIFWKKTGIVCIDFKSKQEYAISRPCVIKENGMYKMWYSFRGENYRIGYAESKDGLRWHRRDQEAGIQVSRSGWDSQMIEYPHVFDHQKKRYLLYNGNDYGKTGIGLAVLSET